MHIVEIAISLEYEGDEYLFRIYSETDDSQLVNNTTNHFTALPDTDGDGLHDAEEEYGCTVKRDINSNGDTDDNIYYGGILHSRETPYKSNE